MWPYKDPKWDEEIVPGYTFRDASNEFGDLKSLNRTVRIDTLNPGELHHLRKVCGARRIHGNAPPIGLRAVPEKEAAQRFFQQTPFYMEYRQMYPWDEDAEKPIFRGGKWPWEEEGYEGYIPPKKDYYRNSHHDGDVIEARLFYMWDGTGWAMSSQWWEGRVIWFRFGCEHQWGPIPNDTKVVRPRLFRCQSFYYCVKCGHSEVVDSSD